jgi:hypothetical protein
MKNSSTEALARAVTAENGQSSKSPQQDRIEELKTNEVRLISGAALVAGIRHHHSHAATAAGIAISHAIEAGRLLQQAKDSMPHGDFGAWVERECGFTYRMARKYMLASKRLGVIPAANWPSTANLDRAISVVIANDRQPPAPTEQPAWLPSAGRAIWFCDGIRTWHAWAVHGVGFDGIEREYMLAMMHDVDSGFVEYMKRGRSSRDDLIWALVRYGLPNPEMVDWREIDAEIPISLHAALREEEYAEWGAKVSQESGHDAR